MKKITNMSTFCHIAQNFSANEKKKERKTWEKGGYTGNQHFLFSFPVINLVCTRRAPHVDIKAQLKLLGVQ